MTATIDGPSRTASYAPAIIAIHWLTVLVIAAVFAAIEIRGYYPKGSDMRGFLTAAHKSLGILVLLLTVIRIAVRSRTPAPAIVPAPPAWQHAIASLTHLILYAALLAMPLLGWLMTSAGRPPDPLLRSLAAAAHRARTRSWGILWKRCTSSSATRFTTSSACTPLPPWSTITFARTTR